MNVLLDISGHITWEGSGAWGAQARQPCLEPWLQNLLALKFQACFYVVAFVSSISVRNIFHL